MIATIQTMIFTGRDRPSLQRVASAIAAITYALVIGWHVLTWFMIGVVMAPTFILLFLSVICLGLNLWSLFHPASLGRLLRWVFATGQQIFGRYFNPELKQAS